MKCTKCNKSIYGLSELDCENLNNFCICTQKTPVNLEKILADLEKTFNIKTKILNMLDQFKKEPPTIDILKFLNRVKDITQKDLEKNHSEDALFFNCVEEMGEYAAAKTIEKGIKVKDLKESSLVEAIDLIICALSLFFLNGGTIENLSKIGQIKLDKWEKRLL